MRASLPRWFRFDPRQISPIETVVTFRRLTATTFCVFKSRQPVVVVLAVVILLVGRDGLGADLSENPGRHAVTRARHHCKCHAVCPGGPCCCSGDAEPERVTTRSHQPARRSSRKSEGPCVGSAPCRDHSTATPTSGPGGSTLSLVALRAVVGPRLGGTFERAGSETTLLAWIGSRIEEPPESPISA